MKPAQISEEQEWQLFELLEGNLSDKDSAELLKAMEFDPQLKAHYIALKQTYLTPSQVIYPNAQALKKSGAGKRVFFYTSLGAAAALAILWFFKATTVTQPATMSQSNLAKQSLNNESAPKPMQTEPFTVEFNDQAHKGCVTLPDLTARGKQPDGQTVEINPSGSKQPINPLITATEPVRNTKNASDSNKIRSSIEVFTSQNKPNNNAQNASQSQAIVAALSVRPPKTKKELLQSFYQDARRMVENGHLPHIKVKAENRDQDWMPEFQVGLTLEKNVILTSFNP